MEKGVRLRNGVSTARMTRASRVMIRSVRYRMKIPSWSGRIQR